MFGATTDQVEGTVAVFSLGQRGFSAGVLAQKQQHQVHGVL